MLFREKYVYISPIRRIVTFGISNHFSLNHDLWNQEFMVTHPYGLTAFFSYQGSYSFLGDGMVFNISFSFKALTDLTNLQAAGHLKKETKSERLGHELCEKLYTQFKRYTEAYNFYNHEWSIRLFVGLLDACFSMFHKGWFTWLMKQRMLNTFFWNFWEDKLQLDQWRMWMSRMLEKLKIIQLSKMHRQKSFRKTSQKDKQPTKNKQQFQFTADFFWWNMNFSKLFQHRHEALSCTYVQDYRVKLQPFILGKWFLVTQKDPGPTVDGSEIRRSPVDMYGINDGFLAPSKHRWLGLAKGLNLPKWMCKLS